MLSPPLARGCARPGIGGRAVLPGLPGVGPRLPGRRQPRSARRQPTTRGRDCSPGGAERRVHVQTSTVQRVRGGASPGRANMSADLEAAWCAASCARDRPKWRWTWPPGQLAADAARTRRCVLCVVCVLVVSVCVSVFEPSHTYTNSPPCPSAGASGGALGRTARKVRRARARGAGGVQNKAKRKEKGARGGGGRGTARARARKRKKPAKTLWYLYFTVQ